ncbi:hypothetical protein RBE51_07365 [Pseudomonas taiwanensis]|uniref:hypothetical protein n=2 Tax=Pseudomonas TaxID=286 RepID=UPI0028DDF298|nr:hypothetical protein [Pseudomonas taiwanensis]MDT8922646.1 hypothetical protein [Pseudomonas taiwanensis]
MSDLKKAMNALKEVHAKCRAPGEFISKRRSGVEWPAELPSSAEVALFYSEGEPLEVKFETGLTPLILFSVEKLLGAQVGYRWVGHAGRVTRNTAWPSSNLVIMDDSGGGKPIIAACGEVNTPVFASYDAVAPFKIASSLADFLMALANMIDVVYHEFNIFDVFDDDGMVEQFMRRMQEDVEPVLGMENFERFIDYFYG